MGNKYKPKLSQHQKDLLHINTVANSDLLTMWERTFITDIRKTTTRGIALTGKQRFYLEKTYHSILKAGKKPTKKNTHKKVGGLSLVQPPKETIFYSGESPPWEN